jgi:transposase
MHSMTQPPPKVIGGVDAHADRHHLVALDERGALLGSASFPTSTGGYEQALQWLESHGRLDAVAVESTGSYAAGLVRHLREQFVHVVEVNQPHPHARRRIGKSDPIDAELAARQLLAGTATAVPKQTTGIVEAIRLLRVARGSAVKARTAATLQLGDLLITAPQPLRDRLAKRKSLRGKASVCARYRLSSVDLADPSAAAKLALRSLAQRIETLDREIAALDRELEQLVKRAAPRTIRLLGISTHNAAQLLTTAGENINRLTSESSFAALCGASPIPASSGKTSRHRLNPGGDRDANRALHLIAVVRLRYCQRTRAYARRRAREGKSKREIIRCLKRYLAREVWALLHPERHPQPSAATA